MTVVLFLYIFRPSTVVVNSKRAEIPKPGVNEADHPSKVVEKPSNVVPAKKRTDVNSNAYLHPQMNPTEFVPSNVVLRTLTPSPKSKWTKSLQICDVFISNMFTNL
jgi:hypothetical protein